MSAPPKKRKKKNSKNICEGLVRKHALCIQSNTVLRLSQRLMFVYFDHGQRALDSKKKKVNSTRQEQSNEERKDKRWYLVLVFTFKNVFLL